MEQRMTSQTDIERTVSEYRNKKIEGKVIDLVPLGVQDLPDVVKLRNHPKMMHFFHQEYRLTLDMQKAWFEKYLARKNDLYWKICSKDGTFLGAIRVYDITPEIADQGSTMLDPDKSMGGPEAAEALLLCLEFLFDTAGVKRVINDNREDNKNMNSLSRRLGFEYLHDIEIRGVKFRHYELVEEKLNRDSIQKIIDMWASR